jgi:hypothetical protein
MAGAHDYTRYTQAEDDPFNKRIRAFRDDSIDSLPDSFENWPKEKIKEAVEGVIRADQRQQDIAATGQNGTSFVALHEEYLDTPANGQLMNHQLRTLYGETLYTLEHFEAAYQALRASGFLALDKKKVAEQERAAAKARVQAELARSVPKSEDELYSMPLEDLRRLDAIENQKRMQRRGEEGGW